MNSSIQNISFDNHIVCLHRFGEGHKIAIGLHGFADKGAAFKSMAEFYGNEYTLICPDLPFHGATLWNDEEFSPKKIASLIETLLKEYDTQSFTLLGHSMGGRIALHLIELLPNKIEKILLLAPAGISKRWYYSKFIVPDFAVRALSRLIMRLNGTPWWYTALHKVGFVNGQSYHFFKKQYSSHARKARLAGVWRSLCHFPVEPEKSADILSKAAIPLEIWVGERDKIIPPADAYYFQRLYPSAVVKVIEGKNHFLLLEP